MIKTLISIEDPLLHQKIKKCSYNLDRVEISKILKDNMIHHKGVGLSANQLGINESWSYVSSKISVCCCMC